MYRPGVVLAQRYRLDERVGGGGMGEVWRGTDTELERTVAVKTVRAELLDEPGFRERFRAEARTMAKIKHPGVVAVHDYYSDESGAFLVMEFIEGDALSGTLRRVGRLDAARVMRLVAEAGDALQAAHDRGVVHRDIKPGNLLVSPDGKLVLTDFGIARSAASTSLTATGALIGTASYLAPEQVLGKPAGPQSDVYALGVVAYECLAGQRPFDGENPFDVAMQRLRHPPPPLPAGIPPQVVAVVDRALAAEPEHRWRSASELAAAARQAAAGGSGTATRTAGAFGPPSTAPSTPPPQHAGRSTPPPPSAPHPSPAPPTGSPQHVPLPPVTPHPPPYQPSTPYPVSGYQTPAYRPPTGYPPGPPGRPVGQNNTLGLLGMIFGIMGVVTACCYIGGPFAIAGIILGALGLKKANDGLATNRGMSIAGIACGGAALALLVLLIAFGVMGEIWSS